MATINSNDINTGDLFIVIKDFYLLHTESLAIVPKALCFLEIESLENKTFFCTKRLNLNDNILIGQDLTGKEYVFIAKNCSKLEQYEASKFIIDRMLDLINSKEDYEFFYNIYKSKLFELLKQIKKRDNSTSVNNAIKVADIIFSIFNNK